MNLIANFQGGNHNVKKSIAIPKQSKKLKLRLSGMKEGMTLEIPQIFKSNKIILKVVKNSMGRNPTTQIKWLNS